jgi:adenosylhomocysteine nucleosidase
MKIGIIGAMVEEIKLLAESMTIIKTTTIGMREYIEGELAGKSAVLVFSRYGKVAASSTVTTLIEIFNVDFVVFTGVAGGADKSLNIGDIVIADKLVQHDMDASPLAVYKKFEIPLLGIDFFNSSEKMVSLAKKSAEHYISEGMLLDVSPGVLNEFDITIPKVTVGTIASGDQFIADSKKVISLATEINNLKCIEMEGAAVAQICFEHNTDFVVFRVISDKADEHANINFSKFIEKAASHFTKGIIQKFISEIK